MPSFKPADGGLGGADGGASFDGIVAVSVPVTFAEFQSEEYNHLGKYGFALL